MSAPETREDLALIRRGLQAGLSASYGGPRILAALEALARVEAELDAAEQDET